jgi:uncharacterized Ntn-hydrolase superfamily protein
MKQGFCSAIMLPRRPVHTYSIVAHDPTTGELGIAVQSHWFCVGTAVVWAEPGNGVMAVQADAEPSYGMRGMLLLAGGAAADDTLVQLLREGVRPEAHQLAVVDRAGAVAVHTGRDCIPVAGHQRGPSYAAQANMMLSPGTWQAMGQAFEAAKGPLADRLLAALNAGEAQGGDLRGKQSAAMVVIRSAATGNRRVDRPVDLRVDDHPDPLAELGRLLGLRKATDLANDGFEHLWQGDAAAAAAAFEAARGRAPEQVEFAFWFAWALLAGGRDAAAVDAFVSVFKEEPQHAVLLERLARMENRQLDGRLVQLMESARKPTLLG